MKKVLFYLGHPAQFHFVKNTVARLKNNGHEVLILIKTKDILEDLLKEDGMDYVNIQSQLRGKGKMAILKASFQRTREVLRRARSFKADVLIGTDSSVAQAAHLLRKPAITVLEDDYEVIRNLAKLTFPYTDCILVPTVCGVGPYEKKKIGYHGYMKLAYLHPNVFQPDKEILSKYGIEENCVLIRLAKLAAHHDVGIQGLNVDLVKRIIQMAEQQGRKVYITSESELDESLRAHQLKIHYKDIHHVLAFAGLLISDSQSMSVEAAMLGAPSLRFNDFAGKISVLEELEHRYELTFALPSSEPSKLCEKVEEMLELPNLREVFQERRKKMLSEKIDVTAFLTWFIENYPNSKVTMRENIDYQWIFK